MTTEASPQVLRESLHRAGYIADEALATTLWLAGSLQRPLLVEGDAGVGKHTLETHPPRGFLLLRRFAAERKIGRFKVYSGDHRQGTVRAVD
jgi:hypothetical protein